MKLQKARKDHICDQCKRKILIGEKYWNSFDDHMATKEHTNCELFKDKLHDPALGINNGE